MGFYQSPSRLLKTLYSGKSSGYPVSLRQTEDPCIWRVTPSGLERAQKRRHGLVPTPPGLPVQRSSVDLLYSAANSRLLFFLQQPTFPNFHRPIV